MSWIVELKDEAEKAGADLKNDEVMYAITPKVVADLFNDHMADEEPPGDWHCGNPPDYWEHLTDGKGRNTWMASGNTSTSG